MDNATVHYGVRPSGEFHIGNAITAVFGCMLLSEKHVAHKTLLMTTNDWDGDNCHQKYDFGRPLVLREEGRSQRAKSMNEYIGFLSEITSRRNIMLRMIPTGHVLLNSQAPKYLRMICERGAEICSILGRENIGVPVFPLHVETGRYAVQTAYVRGKLVSKVYDDGREIIFASDLDSGVPIEMPIEVKLALKHSILDKEVDHFVLGGNYPAYIIDRSIEISAILGVARTYMRAPLLVHGNKVMSKSRGNTVSISDVTRKYGAEQIYSALEREIRKGNYRIQATGILKSLEVGHEAVLAKTTNG